MPVAWMPGLAGPDTPTPFCAGGLSLAVEGPSKAELSCTDNQDGTCSVSYLPVLPGNYGIIVKYNEEHIPGSPFTARITGKLCPRASGHSLCITDEVITETTGP